MVVWGEPAKGGRHVIGHLARSAGEFRFWYAADLERAFSSGFRLLPEFPRRAGAEAPYRARYLFALFAERIPTASRADAKETMERWGVEHPDDQFEVLAKSGGIRATDRLELAEYRAADDDLAQPLELRVAGRRHISDAAQLTIGDLVTLEPDPTNEADAAAVIIARDGRRAGYVPRMYAPMIGRLLAHPIALDARVVRKLIVPDDVGKWVVSVSRRQAADPVSRISAEVMEPSRNIVDDRPRAVDLGARAPEFSRIAQLADLGRLGSRDLIVFIDETGDYSMKAERPYFGFAGVLVFGDLYEDAIASPWRSLRDTHFGGAPKGMHASALQKTTPAQLDALAGFFSSAECVRVAAVITAKAKLIKISAHDAAVDAFVTLTGQAILQMADRIDRVFLVAEDSVNGSPRLARRIEGLKIRVKRDYWDIGTTIEVAKHTLAKTSREPGLEVVDFVAHAAGNQAYWMDNGGTGWRKDFEVTFPVEGPLAPLCRFAKVDEMQEEPDLFNVGGTGRMYQLGVRETGPNPNVAPRGTPYTPPKR